MASRHIDLTPKESQLRTILLDVARYIDESKEIKEKLELRFAGGWVRDKLLNIPSHDIDAAINVTTGLHFCEKLQDYFKDPENMKKHALEQKDLGNLYTVAKNPDKSKHLETATTRILGFDVDFVNLRKETYTEDSRNPIMEFGTAEEDALRRDANINALFYNLTTDQVEDFVGGLADLDAKRIRTPLEPKTTFTDDPLRVLRLIRFASRLDFKIDRDTEICMGEPEVMEALRLKISRERVGIEVGKMLKGPLIPPTNQESTTNDSQGNNPRSSLHFFDRLGLYSAIFTDPTTEETISPDTSTWHIAYECLSQLQHNDTPGSIYKTLVHSEDAKSIAWLLAALVPWSSIPNPPPVANVKQKLPLGVIAAREGLKSESKICTFLAGAFRHFEDITAMKDAIMKKDYFINQRDTLGMQIREWEARGGHWRLQVLFAILVEAMNRNDAATFEALFEEWQAFLAHLANIDLMDAPSIKSIIDGKQLSKELGLKPGIWTGNALKVCMEWQLRNPRVESWEGAVEEVKKRREELRIPL